MTASAILRRRTLAHVVKILLPALILTAPAAWFMGPASGPRVIDDIAALLYSILLVAVLRAWYGHSADDPPPATAPGSRWWAWLFAIVLVAVGAGIVVRTLRVSLTGQHAVWVRVAVDAPTPPTISIRYGATTKESSAVGWQPYARTIVALRAADQDQASLAGARVIGVVTERGSVDLRTIDATGATLESSVGAEALRITDGHGVLLRWPGPDHRLTLRIAGGSGTVQAFWLDRAVDARLGPGQTVDLDLQLPTRWQGWAMLPPVPSSDLHLMIDGAPGRYRFASIDLLDDPPASLLADGIDWETHGCDMTRAGDGDRRAIELALASADERCFLETTNVGPRNIPSRAIRLVAWLVLFLIGLAVLAIAARLARRAVVWAARGGWERESSALGRRLEAMDRRLPVRYAMALALGIAIVWHLAYVWSMPVDYNPDSVDYYKLAEAFRADPRLVSQYFFRTPGYPMFLAAILAVSGGQDLLWIAVGQHALLALLAPLAVWALAQCGVSIVFALLAGVLAACAPALSQTASMVWTESVFAVCAAAALLVFAAHQDRRRRLIVAGMLTGAATLVRPNGFVLLIVLCLSMLAAGWLAVQARIARRRGAMASMTLVIAGYLALAAPMHLHLALVRGTVDLSQGWARTLVWLSAVMQGMIDEDLPILRPDATPWVLQPASGQDPYAIQARFPEAITLAGKQRWEWFDESIRQAWRLHPSRYLDYLYAAVTYNLLLMKLPDRPYTITNEVSWTLGNWESPVLIRHDFLAGDAVKALLHRQATSRYTSPSALRAWFHDAGLFATASWRWLACAGLLAIPWLLLDASSRRFAAMPAYWLAQIAAVTATTWAVDRFIVVFEPLLWTWISAGVFIAVATRRRRRAVDVRPAITPSPASQRASAPASERKRVLVFVVCYHAERFIDDVLARIPQTLWTDDAFEAELLLIDDRSADRTVERAAAYAQAHRTLPITVRSNASNLGYGGNQKVGYRYALAHGFDAVVLLHGDGQYAPEYLPQMVRPIVEGEADVVLGSRMIPRRSALRGRMPLYKWIGNQLLTVSQNALLGTHLAEFHTGYRAYSTRALAGIPFQHNSDYFDFDTDILIQLIDTGCRIAELPVPTFYGSEISRVSSVRYGVLTLMSTVRSRLARIGLFGHPKFEYPEPGAS